ncbi:MAG: ribonuclease domain-containing protein [Nocardioides sp.]
MARRSSSGLGALILVVALAAGIWLVSGREPGTSTGAPDTSSQPSADALGTPYIDAADLPEPAIEVLRRIAAGGPFDYSEDGSTFNNFEALLPDQPRGYYTEYTVMTPGSDDRGARRIVAGENGERYWTDDHYATFSRIRQ